MNNKLHLPWMNFRYRNAQSRRDVFGRFVAFGNDADASGNRFGGDRMVAGDHNDLDAGSVAARHCVRHRSPGRIRQRYQAEEAEVGLRKVLLVSVERVSDREFLQRQSLVADANQPLAHAADFQEGVMEGLTPGARQALFSSVDEHRRASVEDSLRSTQHHQQVAWVSWVVHLVNWHLSFNWQTFKQ